LWTHTNPGLKWFDTDVIGIDQGIILLSAENLLTGNVWKWFYGKRSHSARDGFGGFSPPPVVAQPPKPAAKARKTKSAQRK